METATPEINDYTALLSGDSWNGLEITATPAVTIYAFATSGARRRHLYLITAKS